MAALSMASAACYHGLQQDRAASVSQRPTAFPSLQQRHPRLPLRPTAFPSLRQRHPRLPRRPAAATSAAVRAAQKKVYRSFSDMLQQSKEPVLVEFYATWCGPCQMMGGILDEVAPSMRSRVKFVKVDTERYPTVASQLRIGALPTLILFKDGQPVDRIEGVVAAQDLRNRLQHFCR